MKWMDAVCLNGFNSMARRGEKMPPGYWKELNIRRTDYRRAYYTAHREKIIAHKKKWIEEHKDRHNAYLIQYRESHREVQRQRTKAWRDKNPHQVTAQAAKRRKLLRKADTSDPGVLEFYKIARSARLKTCYYCSHRFRGVADVDHIVPITQGGKHCSSNLCLSCPSCNRKKFTKMPSEFVLNGQMVFDV